MINNLNSSNILALIAWFLQVSNSAVYHLSIMISKYYLHLHPLPPQTFREGIITLCKVIAIARRKPKGDEPDIQPKRNEENGMWQCPLCLRDNFPELSEIWNHFDTTGLFRRAGLFLVWSNLFSCYSSFDLDFNAFSSFNNTTTSILIIRIYFRTLLRSVVNRVRISVVKFLPKLSSLNTHYW